MKLSIVIDNYNYEKYVGEAIDSALSQTWVDKEVIVVDDGSTDSSQEIISSYKDVKPIFKENGGQNSSVNVGVAAATGDVVIILDADDRLDADIGEKAMNAFAADSQLSRAQWPLRIINGDGLWNGNTSPRPDAMRSGDLREDVKRYRTHVWPPQSGNAYSAQVLKDMGPLPEGKGLGSDRCLADITAVLGSIKSFAEPGGDYRVHGANSVIASGLNVARIRDQINWTIEVHADLLRICKEQGIDYTDNVLKPLDVAFLCQRLASLRLEPELHPIKSDKRFALVQRALLAAWAHPQHSLQHKFKRTVWILGVGLGTEDLARSFVERFYFKHRIAD